MKKLIISLALSICTMTALSTSIFANTIKTPEKTVPFTVNDTNFKTEYNCYLIDDTTFISEIDLDKILGSYQKDDSASYTINDSKGNPILFYPLRTTITENQGFVEWNNSTKSCNILVSKNQIFNVQNTTLTSEVYNIDKTPVNIDGTNTYLTIHSVAPVITIAENPDFAQKVNDVLIVPHTNAIAVYDNANKRTTREAFTHNVVINNYYEIVSSNNNQVVINLNTKVDKDNTITTATTTINIDFEKQSVKVLKWRGKYVKCLL